MPTYGQLGKELQWVAEHEAPAHAALNARLRAHYKHSRAQTGSKGDNRHLYGRHRSRNWALHSAYCTNRSYGTRDARDRAGKGDWLRATDVGITGAEHRAASKRLDTAVRAGRLPCLAEWFGSFDGKKVVGWFEGGPGDSDTSHLSHLHLGLWTKFCDDAAQLQLLGDVVTGTEPAPTPTAPNGDDEPMIRAIWYPHDGVNYWLSVGAEVRRPIRTPDEMKKIVSAYPTAPYPAVNRDGFPDTDLTKLGWSRHDVDLTFGPPDTCAEQRYVQHVVNYRLEGVLANRPVVTVPEFFDGDLTRGKVVEDNELAAALAQIQARPGGGGGGVPLDVEQLRGMLLQLLAGAP